MMLLSNLVAGLYLLVLIIVGALYISEVAGISLAERLRVLSVGLGMYVGIILLYI